jgi:SNF2 family DNA or RNA helicase
MELPALTSMFVVRTDGKEDDGLTKKKIPYIKFVATNEIDELEMKQHEMMHYWFQHGKVTSTMINTCCFVAVKDLYEAEQILYNRKVRYVRGVDSAVWYSMVEMENRELEDIDPESVMGSEMWDKLRGFQKTAVRICLREKKKFIGDEMGVGKTIETIGILSCIKDKFPAIVVCPAVMRLSWRNELLKWMGEDLRIEVLTKGKNVAKQLDKDYDIAIVSYPLMRQAAKKPKKNEDGTPPLPPPPTTQELLEKQKFKIAIFDESWTIKRDTKTTRAAISVARHTEYCYMLSGTPGNYPSELYYQLKILYPESLILQNFCHFDRPQKGRFYFANHFGIPEKVRFGGGRPTWRFTGYNNTDELNAFLTYVMLRRRKKDVLSHLPRKNRMKVSLPELPKKVQKEIKDLLKQEVEDGKARKSLYMEAYRLTATHKIPYVLDVFKNTMMDHMRNDKMIIFVHHKTMQNAVAEFMEENRIKFFAITATTSAEQRAKYVHDFQTNKKYNVAILSIMTSCAGITLTASNTVVFTEIMSRNINLQAEDRIHRISQTRQSNIYYLIAPHSTDDMQWYSMMKKEREMEKALEGEEGYLPSIAITHEEMFKPGRKKRKKKVENYKPIRSYRASKKRSRNLI